MRAQELFDQLEWAYFFRPSTERFHHAWKPNCGSGFQIAAPDGVGCLSNQEWDRPTDEVLLINLLALASAPDDLCFERSLYAWPREVNCYPEDPPNHCLVNSFFGSMFTYFFGQIFLDFEQMGLDDPDDKDFRDPVLGDPMQRVDWFENARKAAMANRQFVVDQGQADPDNFATYSEDQWGLSPCFRPPPLADQYFGRNGAKPREVSDSDCRDDPCHDGTVPPYGSTSTMPLVRTSETEELSDNIAFQALRHYYDAHFCGLWGKGPYYYGPRDSLKTTLVDGQPFTAYSQRYVGIDVGPEALMIENYRTGLLHQHFMTHMGIREAVRAQFPAIDKMGNTPPVLWPIDDGEVQEGHLLTLELEAQDAEDDGLTYGVDPLPEGATITRNVFRWTPGSDQAGDYKVTFFVSDGVFQTPETATITVCEGCPSDLSGDCEVGPLDLAILLGNWGPCPGTCTPGDPEQTCAADFSGNCDVGPFDLAILLGNWGQCT